MLPRVVVMSRRDCCLCEDAKRVVASLADEGLCSWETVDVDRDKKLLVKYGNDVPVILLDGEEVARHRIGEPELRALLSARKVEA